MAIFEEVEVITRREIDEFDNVRVVRVKRVLKDGVVISESLPHSHVVPAHDGTDDSGEDAKVRAVLQFLRDEKQEMVR